MIHIAIVSHGHEELLIASNLGGLLQAGEGIRVWVKDNKPSARLKTYCHEHLVTYFDRMPGLGFGENNNFLYAQIKSESGFQQDDYFVVLNPDLSIAPETLLALIEQMKKDACVLATINLYRDQEYLTSDANIRRFPTLFSLLRMTIKRSITKNYDKKNMRSACHVDWASGAFLVFDAMHYAALQGFDQAYFMYFEDVDICYRSQQLLGKGVLYYPQFKAIHLAAHKNRNIVSQHAIWFFSSFMKFLSRRYFLYQRQKPLSASNWAK
ncbi:glycosyltransferase [Undibacterium sp. RuTC16W]|uniref:glycosyltransferase n=1 Tax=Undibacterium sp. RuTC16W TaxID=3413048 RepID=UPI003BF3B4C3